MVRILVDIFLMTDSLQKLFTQIKKILSILLTLLVCSRAYNFVGLPITSILVFIFLL